MADDRRGRRVGWSVRVGTILGIPIRIHFTFLLLLVWFGAQSARQGDDLALAIAFLLAVFGCVLLHELGHALTARGFGVRTRDIVLYPIGGIARLENMPGGAAELFVAIAGPLVNLALALAGAFVLALSPLTFELTETLVSANEVVTRLLLANVVLFAFNLIPAFPMDGGRVLRAGLSLMMPVARATRIATSIGQAVAVVFGIASFTIWQNPVLLLIALFVFLGASQEALWYRQRAAVRGHTARDAMVTRFETLAPQDSLDDAAHRLLATHQQDFPVVDAWQRVVGLLSRARLLEGLGSGGRHLAVLEVMDRDVAAIAPQTDLDTVLQFLRGRPDRPVVVLDGGVLMGMITLENLSEFIEVSARAGTGARSQVR